MTCISFLGGYAQTYHTLQKWQTYDFHWGSLDYLHPHCAFKSYATNRCTIYALSSGTSYAFDYSGNLHIFTVLDVTNIDIPERVEVKLGESYTYTPIITDIGAATTLTWTSSNPAVAIVASNGQITATGLGKTTITCQAANLISAQSLLTVLPVETENVALNLQKNEMSIGDIVQLAATLTPANVTFPTVKWLSTNENVAQVDDEGTVTSIAPGYCSIYAIADDGSRKYDKCLIHVNGNAGNGDLNNDGETTVADVTTLVNMILEKE